jgi:hypothetical protein
MAKVQEFSSLLGYADFCAPTALLSSTCDIFFTAREESMSFGVYPFINLRF